MQIIPVIDLRGGTVVHAMRGQREFYRPVQSRLTAISEPADIAAALAEWGFSDVYVADLDAIERGEPNIKAIEAIAATGLHLWLDAGSQTCDLDPHAKDIVVGLESLTSLEVLDHLLTTVGNNSLVFSLDHRGGSPITRIAQWKNAAITHIVEEVASRGVRRFIDLDLARVGAGEGPQGRGLINKLRRNFRDVFVAIGGGVHSIDDVRALAESGYDAVLVATALHSGSITSDDVQPFIRRAAANPSLDRVFPEKL